jgi:uncharacterized protein YceH (UPF0502 family)
VKYALDRLGEREAPLVRRLPRGAGQREDRYAHLLSGEPAMPERGTESSTSRAQDNDAMDALLARIEALEARVDALEAAAGNTAGCD